MEKHCIVTGGSGNDAAPMGVLLLNLKETQTWIDQAVIYHDGGISCKDRTLMQSIMPVEFVEYRFPGDTSRFNEIIRYVYTETIFCKYECLKLLERFDQVVWTDYDVLFLRDIPELLDFTSNASGMKSLISPGDDACGHFWGQIRKEGFKELGKICPLDSLSIFTGIMVFSRQLSDSERLYMTCVDLTARYGEYLVHPEQAVFDMATRQVGIVPESIPWNYATRPIAGEDAPADARILHAVAQPKFWNGLTHPVWNAYYAKWLSLGGSRWRPISVKLFLRFRHNTPPRHLPTEHAVVAVHPSGSHQFWSSAAPLHGYPASG